MQYLSRLELHETLVISSGLPLVTIPNRMPDGLSACTDVRTIWNDAQRLLSQNKQPKQTQTQTILQISNGMCIPNYSSSAHYNDYFALGVSQYGQMTAGSYCYIGPQGIVHGTTICLMSIAELYFPNYLSEFKPTINKQPDSKSFTISDRAEFPFASKHIVHKACGGEVFSKSSDKLAPVFLTSGLGGMSGAQPKAGLIANVISITAEVNFEPLIKRFNQGWLNEIITDLDTLIERMRAVKAQNNVTSIGYYGNVIQVWERLVELHRKNGEVLVNLGSDQTSCHNIMSGGYMPVGMSFEAGNRMLSEQPEAFAEQVKRSLIRHTEAINYLSEKTDLKFWDYGNAFLLEACKANADIVLGARPEIVNESNLTSITLKYQSYFQLIMDDIFSLGFGPFRWICSSNDEEDLKKSDRIAAEVVLEERDALKNKLKAMDQNKVPKHLKDRLIQLNNNLTWITEAEKHKLVVGCKARILYCDKAGRTKVALKFNEAIKKGYFRGPIVLSRDHHDVSSTDSPYRETSNIADGSKVSND